MYGIVLTLLQALTGAVVVARFARGRRRRAPLAPGAPALPGAVSVVVPARDEEARLAGCLAPLRGEPGVDEVLVVDDESADATAAVAEAHGARVIAGAPLPPGWAGKAWALEQGLHAARGEWVVFLDADTRPRRGLVRALVEAAAPVDLLSAAPCFVCESPGERLLHPALAATIPYRAGPTDVPGWQPRPARATANGQCLVVRRDALIAAGGWARVRANTTEDVALARATRRAGGSLAFVDAADLLEVRMFASAAETWRGWRRSLMAPDVNGPAQLAGDLAVLWLCQALPLARVLARRSTLLDRALLAVRLALHAAFARAYRPRGAAFWLAPLADLPVVAGLTWSALRPDRTWRGRVYGARGRAGR